MLSVTGFKQMGHQSGFKCSGRQNVSNFTRQGIPDRWSDMRITAMPKCVGLHTWNA